MNLIFKGLGKLLRAPVRLSEYIEARRKAEACSLEAGARLGAPSRIGNLQGDRSAITVGSDSEVLGELVVFPHGGKIAIGKSCFIGDSTRIWSEASVTIGDRVLISHGVNIHDSNSHSLSAELRHKQFNDVFGGGHPAILEDVRSTPILIEDDAWIGFHAVILKGVRVGKGAVVGAGSIVTSDVPDYAVVAGNPAKVIGAARP